jgi:hypothetical protein
MVARFATRGHGRTLKPGSLQCVAMGDTRHADYSGTPLPKKLGLREGASLLVIGAPQGFSLGPLPSGVEVLSRTRAPIDVALLFVTRRAELTRRFRTLARALDPAGRLWVAWPKKAAGVATDLTFEVVQRTGLDAGLVDNKSASIDSAFQGLQFVVRLRDRASR